MAFHETLHERMPACSRYTKFGRARMILTLVYR